VTPTQAAPVAQLLLVEQLIPHAVPLQMLGLHIWVDAGGQLPAPSQVAALVAVPLVQLAVRQDVAVVAKTQAVDTPLHDPPHGAAPVHAGWPVRGAPATTLQVPASAAEALQYSQDPVQAVLQQTPSTQVLLAHSRAPAHNWPFAFLGVQVVPTQKLLTQSVSAAHVAGLHAVVDAHTTPPAQVVVAVGVTQVPEPLQAGTARSCAALHAVVPQLVVAGVKWQAPAPSQVPSRPHGMVDVSLGHLVLDDPPALMGRHSPLASVVSASPHDMQVPAHALSQQMLPTQFPSEHSLFATHVAPLPFVGVHTPVAQ
jgi:hypothetical protein